MKETYPDGCDPDGSPAGMARVLLAAVQSEIQVHRVDIAGKTDRLPPAAAQSETAMEAPCAGHDGQAGVAPIEYALRVAAVPKPRPGEVAAVPIDGRAVGADGGGPCR